MSDRVDIRAKSGHSDAQDWASPSECPDVKNYKWRLSWLLSFKQPLLSVDVQSIGDVTDDRINYPCGPFKHLQSLNIVLKSTHSA